MATCTPNTLLSSGAGFQAASERGLNIIEAELCREWAGGTPSVNSILSDGSAFQKLSDKELSICQAQLLCNIVGGV